MRSMRCKSVWLASARALGARCRQAESPLVETLWCRQRNSIPYSLRCRSMNAKIADFAPH